MDAWVVYDNLLQSETHPVARDRTMLVTGEPPSIRRYRSVFTSQFGSVRTSHATLRHKNLCLGHEAQPWHYAMRPGRCHPRVLSYDDLVSMNPPNKRKLISVISSNKAVTDDHRQRLLFVEQLKSAFGEQIDVFGRGIRDVQDKSDAIWEYRYHVVLENDHSEYYMSEKLPDAFLGWSFPFYSGGKYADAVFPKDSFARIDMYDPVRSIETIRSHLGDDSYSRRLDRIAEARKNVLDKTNMFAVLCNAYDDLEERLSRRNATSHRKICSTTLYPKRQSVRLGVMRFMRAFAVAA